MFGLNMTELLIILAVVLLLFGSTKLPALFRSLGRSVVEFKKGAQGIDEDAAEAPHVESNVKSKSNV